MGTTEYEEDRAFVLEALLEDGKQATLKSYSETGDRWDPVISYTDYTVQILDVDYTVYEIDGDRVKREDKKVYIAAEGVAVVPKISDKIVINSITYNIKDIMPFIPGDVVVFWVVQVRK